jgi:DNA-binding ferritin-like protein
MELSGGVLAARHEGTERILARLLADESLLYTQTRNYYRSAVGHDLTDLPELFESQCQRLEKTIHEVVERIRPLGGMVPRILARFLEHSQLDAQAPKDADARALIATLLANHKAIVRSLQMDLDVIAAEHRNTEMVDFLGEIMEEHQGAVWTLCSLMEEQMGLIGRASDVLEFHDLDGAARQASIGG